MSIVLDGTSGVIVSGNTNTLSGVTVGRGAGSVASNTVVGSTALASNSTGAQVVALGYGALNANTASDNTAVGYLAAGLTTTGTNNTAIGRTALYANTTGSKNISVGEDALRSNTTASNNTAVGYQALYSLVGSGGTGNTVAVGYLAGSTSTDGRNSIFLGANAQPAAASDVNELVIGTINSTGKGSGTGYINAAGGGVYQGNNSSSWSVTSDERIKTNFKAVTNGLEIINALEPWEFDYIVSGKHDVNFKAQQYMTVLPDQVSKHAASPEEKEIVGEDEIYGIQRNLDPYFVSAIKSLTKQVELLKAEIAALKGTA